MSEIPTLAEYDSKKAKVRCSLQWVISYAYKEQDEPKLPHADVEFVFESDGGLKENIAMLLCSGDPYCLIAKDIFDIKEPLRSHEDVIQILCRKGLYVLDNADSLITAQDLRKVPLALTSHLTIIDMLMFASVSCKLAPINSIVSTVKKFAPFSASKDLPDNIEEALLLWLNKVSQKVQCLQRNAFESDKHTFGQPREEESDYPILRNLTEDMFDGCSLAVLLHYYCPSNIRLHDIALKDTISMADAWHNIQTSLAFCNDILLPHHPWKRNVIPPSILHPIDLLFCGLDFKINLLTFLGTLYHFLENDALENIVCPLGHVVTTKRRNQHSFNLGEHREGEGEALSGQRPLTLEERHQETLCQVNQIIPGIQPLISDVTKLSFHKSSGDRNSMVSSNVSSSENFSSPAPFSSKPVLVKRNRDVHMMQPTSTAKLPMPAHHDHFSRFQDQSQYGNTNGHINLQNPSLKSSLHQECRNTPDVPGRVPAAPANKWQARITQDTRNTNTSNNIYGPMHGVAPNVSKGPYYQHHNAQSISESKASTIPMLLSNVEVGSDLESESQNFHRSIDVPHSVNLDWPGFEHINQAADHRYNSMKNDLRLETARTSVDHSSPRSPRSLSDSRSTLGQTKYDTSGNVSDSTGELTSVSSRTNLSSNEASTFASGDSVSDSTHIRRPSPRRYPAACVDDFSPEKPVVAGLMPDCHSSRGHDFGTDTNSVLPSQQSYTVHSRAFHNIDSARAAGYPIIESSPPRQQQKSHEQPVMSLNRTSRALPSNTKSQSQFHDKNVSATNGEATAEEQRTMMVGDQVVRLRNPNNRRSRAERTVKTTSWIEVAQQQKRAQQEAEKRRPRSFVISPTRMADLKRKIKEKRRCIEDYLEKEKRKGDREWAKSLLAVRKDMHAFAQRQEIKQRQPVKATLPDQSSAEVNTRFPDRVKSTKNEETSSDYSSKSPSPSSVNHNSERVEYDQPVSQKFPERKLVGHSLVTDKSLKEVSSQHNFFASPLSSTTYLMPGFDDLRPSLQQSYQNQTMRPTPKNAVPGTTSTNHEQVLNVSPHKDPSQVIPERNLTYCVSQKKQKVHQPESYHKQYAVAPHINNMTPVPSEDPLMQQKQSENRTNGVTVHQSVRESPHGSIIQSPTRADKESEPKSTKRDGVEPQQKTPKPEITILQPVSPAGEVATRRTLFPAGGHEATHEQENIDPNNLTVDQRNWGTYDSFCKLPGSNHSTPAKTSPVQNLEEMTPIKNDGDTEAPSFLLKTHDRDRKGGEGFELLDEHTPNIDLAKKKEQFLLKQLKKEEELKRKKADRENLAEKKKEETRLKQEEAAAKKEAERLKKAQRLEEYKKRKMRAEEAQLIQQSSGIISGGSAKKHPNHGTSSDQLQHSSRPLKATRSGRSSPALDITPPSLKNRIPATNETPPNADTMSNQMTFNVTASSDHSDNVTAKPVRTRKLSCSGKKDWETGSATSSAVSSDYAGPKLYKQPSSKSNRNIIHNAISHCCLPGKVNESLRSKTIQVLETSDARHFMVLFRDSNCQYRSLYSYDPDSERLHRLSGHGPTGIVPSMIERLFKYNSGRKAFVPLPSKTLSVSIDAITIKNNLWQTTKKHAAPHSATKK